MNEDKVRDALLRNNQVRMVPKSKKSVKKETGEEYKSTIEHLTFNPLKKLSIIHDSKINLYDNGGSRPHKFQIEFSLNRDIAGIKKGTFINLLDHTLTCKLGVNTGMDDYRRAQVKLDDLEASYLLSVNHKFIDDVFLAMRKERKSRLPNGAKNISRIWSGINKTATSWGLKRMDYTAAYWVGDEDIKYSGELVLFFGNNRLVYNVRPLAREYEINKNGKNTGDKLIATGELIDMSTSVFDD